MLRSNLLQPLNDIEAINSRLDVVDEFIRKKDLLPEFRKGGLFWFLNFFETFFKSS